MLGTLDGGLWQLEDRARSTDRKELGIGRRSSRIFRIPSFSSGAQHHSIAGSIPGVREERRIRRELCKKEKFTLLYSSRGVMNLWPRSTPKIYNAANYVSRRSVTLTPRPSKIGSVIRIIKLRWESEHYATGVYGEPISARLSALLIENQPDVPWRHLAAPKE